MLKGNIIYKHRDKVPQDLVYYFEGADNSLSLQGRITAKSYAGVELMEGEKDTDASSTKRVGFNLTSVKVQTRKITVKKENKQGEVIDKEVPKPVNNEFFTSLGATIRYAKKQCCIKNSVDYIGFDTTDEYVPCTKRTYNIPIDIENSMEKQIIGTVSLSVGNIESMHIETPYWKIDLDTTEEDDLEPLYDADTNVSKGFKFSTEYLGFYLEPIKTVKSSSNSLFGLYGSLEEIVKNNPDKSFDWLLDRAYYIVDDNTLDDVVAKIMAHDGIVSFDTETSGVDINFYSRVGQADQCVGVVLSVTEGESYYFPMQMKSIPNLCNGDHWYFMEHYMKPILEGKELVAHNMVFDWKVAYIYGINANIVHDTMAIFKLTLGAENPTLSVALKKLTAMILNRDSLELDNMVEDNSWGESDIKFWDLPYELVRLYAPADTDNTLALLHYAQKTDLLHRYNAEKVYEIEIAFSYAVAYQEFYGHRINIDKIPQLTQEVEDGLSRNYEKMKELVGYDFNPNSSPQLIRIMYTELGIPEQRKRTNNRLTSDKETLAKLAEIEDIDGNPKYPFVVYLKKYRDYEAIRKSLLKSMNELATEDGYMFTEVQQYGTTTGRVSVKEPNYQSYNNTVKKYVVPREGYYFTDSDYSSIEYRVLASMARQEALIDAFEDPELDYHSYQASRMFNVPYELVTKKLRKSAKGINFGLPYGMGDESLGVRIFGEASKENTQKAGALRKKYFVGQEKIQKFFEDAREHSVRDGFTETYFGRRRYYNRAKFSDNKIRRQGGNQRIQGTAADLYKLAMGRLFKAICREGWLGKVLFPAFVHDEVLSEVHKTINPTKYLKVLRECFEMDIEGFCKLYVGFGYGRNWYEAKSVELPTKLQQEMVAKWGTTGYPDWDGDTDKFCDRIPTMIRDFEIRTAKENIVSEESQGKTIKPTISTYIYDNIEKDVDLTKKEVLRSYKTEYNLDDETCKCLEKKFEKLTVQEQMTKLVKSYGDINESMKEIINKNLTSNNISSFVSEIPQIKDLKSDIQKTLDIFCKLHNVDRGRVNIKTPEEVSTESMDIGELNEEDTDDALEKRLEEMKNSRIEMYGLYTDVRKGVLTLKVIPDINIMTLIKKSLTTENKGGYKVMLKDCTRNILYNTSYYCSSKDVNYIQQIYMMQMRKEASICN